MKRKAEKIMLNVGVIGCGGMGRDHIKRITERTQGAQVVAVSDVCLKKELRKQLRSQAAQRYTQTAKT